MSTALFVQQAAAAFIGTIAFSLLFGIPKKYFLMCGTVAAIGWVLYSLLVMNGLTSTESIFLSTLLVVFLSRFASVWMNCPVTVFLIAGIFPLIPGGGIYWTAYYLVMGNGAQAITSGFGAIKAVVAIVLGIVIILEIPNGFFHLFSKKQ